jgi:cellulose synthase/poly-beta-1,6-N-acetylglucosamine synthase-like glycosyltransferase
MSDVFVSAIIPAWHDESVLQETLKALARVDYPRNEFDVIIVAGGEETVKIAGKFAGKTDLKVQILQQKEEGGKNQAILDGLEKADGDIIVLLDADTIVEPQWLKELIKPLLDGELEVVNGSRYPVKETWVSRYFTISKEIGVEKLGLKLLYGNAGIAFYRKLIEGREQYYFDPEITMGVDQLLFAKLMENKLRFDISRNAVVRTHMPTTLREFVITGRRWDDASIPFEKEVFNLSGRIYNAFIASCFILSFILPGLFRILPLAVILVFILRRGVEFVRIFRHHERLGRLFKFTYFLHWIILSFFAYTISTYSTIKYLLGLTKMKKHFKGPRPRGD